jgi:hypothetical protein
VLVFAVYAGVDWSMLRLATSVERSLTVYPYRHEDWLRYLMPTLFEGRGPNRIMLVGESAVRENLLFEQFDRAFPTMRTFQGALSLGTIDDVVLALEYVEQAYGEAAMPGVLVVGVSPRFAANLPRTRPFLRSLTRYSPVFYVRWDDSGPHLEPKGRRASILGRVRFHVQKSPERYRAAVSAIVRAYLYGAGPPASAPAWLWEAPRWVPSGVAVRLERSVHQTVRYSLPYRWLFSRPLPPEEVRAMVRRPQWARIHAWRAQNSRQVIVGRVERLLALAQRHRIRVFVLNLPESGESRVLYDPGLYADYLSVIRAAFGSLPFLDVRQLLEDDEFIDVVHATPSGAARVTHATIDFLMTHGILSTGATAAKPDEPRDH